MTAVIVEHVSKHYELGGAMVRALDDVSLEIQGGEFIALAGTSGSGKTTLLNIIGTIESPTSGSIRLNSIDTGELTPDELSDFRAKEIGFVFQTFNLLPVLTATENVQYPLYLRKLRPRERRMRAEAALEAVGLIRYREHRPSELSGGQRQRVAIARAIVAEPTIILADEPTANLDRETGAGILQLMANINEERGTTFLISTHDPTVMHAVKRVVKMSGGMTRSPR